MQSVHIIYCFECKVSVLFTALYAHSCSDLESIVTSDLETLMKDVGDHHAVLLMCGVTPSLLAINIIEVLHTKAKQQHYLVESIFTRAAAWLIRLDGCARGAEDKNGLSTPRKGSFGSSPRKSARKDVDGVTSCKSILDPSRRCRATMPSIPPPAYSDCPMCLYHDDLDSCTQVFLGLGFHNCRGLCANLTHILVYFSPIIKDSRVLTVMRRLLEQRCRRGSCTSP